MIPRNASALLRFVFKLLISIGLVLVLFMSTDTKGLANRLIDINTGLLLLACAVMALLSFIPAMRWLLLIRLASGKVELKNVYRLVMIGNFFGQFLPSIGGDIMRAWYMHRLGVPLGEAANSVVLDRMIALAGLLVLAMISFPWLSLIVPAWFSGWMAMFLMAVIISVLLLPRVAGKVPLSWERWKPVCAIQKLASTGKEILDRKWLLFSVLGLSLASHLSIAAFVYCLARMAGVPVELGDCILLVPLVMLVTVIPVSVAGWGIREGAMVIAFAFLNVASGDALLVSILFGITVAISSIPGGVFWIMMGRRIGKAKVDQLR